MDHHSPAGAPRPVRPARLRPAINPRHSARTGHSLRGAAAALGVGSLLLTGCGTGSAGGPGSSGVQAELRERLPKEVRSAGVLQIGSYLNYVPVDFKDKEGKPAGLDPDLATAIAGYLGLRAEFVDMSFEKLFPALQAGEVDAVMSAVIDTRPRQRGTADTAGAVGAAPSATVGADDSDKHADPGGSAGAGGGTDPGLDFVDYFHTSTLIVVKAGNPLNITSLDSLCGRTVAVQRGTVQDELATRQTASCQREGKPLQIHRLETDEQALAEVAAGTAAADLNDYPVAEYNTKQAGGGRFQLASTRRLTSGPYGITFTKRNTALRDVVAKALDQLIRNGEYDKILAKWNVQGGAISSAVVNGG